MIKSTSILLVLMLILLSAMAAAEVPGQMNYQGTLTDDGGTALDTTISMTFTIYDDSTAGAVLWTETQPGVVVAGGIFNIRLGTANTLSNNTFNDPDRWLGIQVGGDLELEPRQRIAAVGYAFRAAEADTADYARGVPGGSDGDWTISGDDMYSAVPGNVGIGTVSPEFKLSLDGDGAIIAKGTYGAGDSLITSGTGTRLIWYPRKAAFRAGGMDFSYWDDAYIGDHSVAFGRNTGAHGSYAFAAGFGTAAIGDASIALGRDTFADGHYSLSTGYGSSAYGDYSTAMGMSSEASGDYSFAMGQYAQASGYRSVAMGYRVVAGPTDNTMVLGTSPGSGYYLLNNIENSLMIGFNSDTPTLFVGPSAGAGTIGKVGIGTTSPAEKLHVSGNAHIDSMLTVNGNVGIGTASPDAELHVEGTIEVDQKIQANDSGGLELATDEGTTRLSLRDNGNVGIWTTTPNHALHVAGHEMIQGPDGFNSSGEQATLYLGDTAKYLRATYGGVLALYSNDPISIRTFADSSQLHLKTNGRVGVGTDNPTRKFWVNGDAGGTSAWYNDSDERLKQDIKNIEGALEKITQLRGINFRWRDIEHHPRGLQMGLIAQEVKEVVPEVVEKKGEYYSLATSNLVPLLIEAIKEQQRAIEEQASKIVALQAQLDALR